jgi:hypothetical protein
MASERDIELLDDYLMNRLSAEDRVGFEKKLAADPELMQEFRIQTQVIEGLKEVRRMELKKMLQNTAVPPVDSSVTLFSRLLPWVGASALVVIGFFWFNRLEEPVPSGSVQQAIHPVEKTRPTAEVEMPDEQPVLDEKAVSKPIQRKQEQPVKVSEPVKVEVYDPTQEISAETTTPAELSAQRTEAGISKSNITVNVIDHKKYSQHYAFENGTLMLYGPFEKNLYEILEFIGEEKTTAFLYYKNSFYKLDTSIRIPTKLVPVTNNALLQKLKEYRAQ